VLRKKDGTTVSVSEGSTLVTLNFAHSTKFTIRVVKCSSPEYWYLDKIGWTFKVMVESNWPNDYVVYEKRERTLYHIDRVDAVII